jgi:hypothetical protein
MGHAVLKKAAEQPKTLRAFALIHGGKSSAPQSDASVSPEIIALGLILALLQVFDGILTGIGMSQFGTSMEGNMLLRSLMGVMGYIPALVIVKGASILLVGVLCLHAPKVSWLKPAFIGVIALYLCMAVIPWTYILLVEFLA